MEPKKINGIDELSPVLNNLPIHTQVELSKDLMQKLPDNFEKTSLGYSVKNEISQYRGQDNIHVHELADRFIAHKDAYDPRSLLGAIGHAFADAPEIGFGITVGLTSGIAIGKLVYDLRKENSENADLEAAFWGGLAGFGFGLLTFLAIRGDN